jgi:putative aldouronate transport system permease protein
MSKTAKANAMTIPAASRKKDVNGGKLKRFFVYARQHWLLYVMLIPGLFFLFIYKLLPLYGLQIAFKDYKIFSASNPIAAIKTSPWVGFANFQKLFGSSSFIKVLRNTLVINFQKILWLFPIPICCAILLNEIRNKAYQRLCQTLIYVPYFFSWVLIFGIFYSLLGTYGIVNNVIVAFGGTRVGFLTSQSLFRSILVFTEGWKEIGYNTVIYLAAITGIDSGLYEAARIDGANKWQQIWHITMPGILPTIVLMLILKVGHILSTGFEQVLVFYSPAVYDVGDIIETYVYRLGLGQMDFSLATALGLFNSVVAFILIVGANTVSKKTLGRSIW